MRKILKALSLVMVLVMCFTMVFTTAVSAEGTDTLVLSVDNAAPKAGETVNITVTSNFTTVAGAHFAIDLAGLEYVSVAGDYAEYFSAETMNFVKEFNEDNGNLVESGVLFVITATVPADAEAGTVYNVGFGTINASKEFCDYDLNEVVVTKTGVDVTVAADAPAPCAHEWTYVHDKEYPFVAATEGTKGSLPLTCSLCGEKTTKEVMYHAGTKIASYGADAQAEIVMRYDVRLENFAKGYDIDSMLVVLDKYVWSEDGTADRDVEVHTAADVDEVFREAGRPADTYRWFKSFRTNELTDTVIGTVFIQVDGQWYNGSVMQRSFLDYAKSRLSNAGVSANIKRMIVDLLNFATAIQKFNNFNMDNLPADSITQYQNLGSGLDYRPDAKDDRIIEQDKTSMYFSSIGFEGASRLLHRYQMKNGGAYTGDMSDVTIVVTPEVGESVTYVDYDYAVANNLTDKIEKGEYYTHNNGTWTFYHAVFASEMRVEVDATLYVGDTRVAYLRYNAETYAARTRKDNGSVSDDMCNYLLAYGDSAARVVAEQ